jgi:hypothetical protein
MALYQDPVTEKDIAIVHACRPMMLSNAERNTVITESWHLQHYINYIDANDAMIISQKKYGKDHVPARIMALYQDPVTGKDIAIVHACCPMMLSNAERNTVITESWHLQHYIDYIDANDAMKDKILVPVYNPIPADQLLGRVRVYMETQQILESWDDLESSGHVIMATQRSTHWAKAFLSHETDSNEEEESETESDT